MALDMAKYQKLFLEEAAEHLEEISRALLVLEKDTDSGEAIDTIFRMAHSIKSMAASLGYDSVSELSHRLEDRLGAIRGAGRLSGPGDLALLFKGLEGLEQMVETVRETGENPPPEELLCAELTDIASDAPDAGGPVAEADPGTAEAAKKKLRS